jgi:hypothetical protein
MKRAKRKPAKARKRAPKTAASQRFKLKNNLEVEVDVRPTDHGYMVLHRLRGAQTLTVTCTCEGKGSVTKTCTYADGVVPSPLCDCTGSTPSITC